MLNDSMLNVLMLCALRLRSARRVAICTIFLILHPIVIHLHTKMPNRVFPDGPGPCSSRQPGWCEAMNISEQYYY